jgi:hypothetical protein
MASEAVEVAVAANENMDLSALGTDDPNVNLNVSVSEVSKGGLKYEVIIADHEVVPPPRGVSPALGNNKPAVSAELIELKISAAAERRQSLEAERLAALALKFRKIDEASKKREEEEANFINATKENLEQNMKLHIDNRETRIADIKSKLNSHHFQRLQEVRQNLETSLTEQEVKLKQDLETKLEAAEKNREKMIQEKLESLKKHDEKVEMIRSKRSSMCEPTSENGTSVPASE